MASSAAPAPPQRRRPPGSPEPDLVLAIEVEVEVGQAALAGQSLLVRDVMKIEAMKIAVPLDAPCDGVVLALRTDGGERVALLQRVLASAGTVPPPRRCFVDPW